MAVGKFSIVIDTIRDVIDPFDLMVLIKRGQPVADIAHEIVLKLSKLKYDNVTNDVDEQAFETIIALLGIIFSAKGCRYTIGTEDCNAIVQLHHIILEHLLGLR